MIDTSYYDTVEQIDWSALSRPLPAPAPQPKPLTFVSLFAGIGGFDLGFERAGMQCVAQVEWNAKASAVLAGHYPNVKRFGDVRDVGKHNLGTVDLICGGFPCQDVSVAGKRAGLAGERSGLWFEFLRILTEVAPRYVVIENVPGLLSSNGGRDFAAILHGLVERGYRVGWRVLDAQYFGVSQRRRRVFLVGYLGDGRAAEILFEREGCKWDSPPRREAGAELAGDVAASLRARGDGTGTRIDNETGLAVVSPASSPNEPDALAQAFRLRAFGEYAGDDTASAMKARDGKDATDLVVSSIDVRNLVGNGDISGTLQAKENGGYSLNYTNPILHRDPERAEQIERWIETGEKIPPRKREQAQTAVAFTERTRKDGRNFEAQEEIAYALTNPGSGGRTHSRQIAGAFGVRRLTSMECERLQGFPDGWTAGQSDSERYRQLGNAVAVPVVEWIGRRLVAAERAGGQIMTPPAAQEAA